MKLHKLSVLALFILISVFSLIMHNKIMRKRCQKFEASQIEDTIHSFNSSSAGNIISLKKNPLEGFYFWELRGGELKYVNLLKVFTPGYKLIKLENDNFLQVINPESGEKVIIEIRKCCDI